MIGNSNSLAGSCLLALMHDTSSLAAVTALAVTTASFSSARKARLPVDVCACADQTIERLGQSRRERTPLVEATPYDPPADTLPDAMQTYLDSRDDDALAGALGSVTDQLRHVAASAVAHCEDRIRLVNHRLLMQDEELQMLWWLVGQHSWDLARAFARVPATFRALVFAKELADHTEFLPGPPSIGALLSRAGLANTKRMRVSTAIEAAPRQWLGRLLLDVDPSPVSTPLHFGIKRKLEADEEEVWIPLWTGMTDIPRTCSLTPLGLATLFYRERLLMRES